MVSIPRAELQAVADRHGMDYNLEGDPTVAWVRDFAAGLRFGVVVGSDPGGLLAEAADLEALADRYEQEAPT